MRKKQNEKKSTNRGDTFAPNMEAHVICEDNNSSQSDVGFVENDKDSDIWSDGNDPMSHGIVQIMKLKTMLCFAKAMIRTSLIARLNDPAIKRRKFIYFCLCMFVHVVVVCTKILLHVFTENSCYFCHNWRNSSNNLMNYIRIQKSPTIFACVIL